MVYVYSSRSGSKLMPLSVKAFNNITWIPVRATRKGENDPSMGLTRFGDRGNFKVCCGNRRVNHVALLVGAYRLPRPKRVTVGGHIAYEAVPTLSEHWNYFTQTK